MIRMSLRVRVPLNLTQQRSVLLQSSHLTNATTTATVNRHSPLASSSAFFSTSSLLDKQRDSKSGSGSTSVSANSNSNSSSSSSSQNKTHISANSRRTSSTSNSNSDNNKGNQQNNNNNNSNSNSNENNNNNNNAKRNPWSNVNKGISKSEERIANALKNNREGGNGNGSSSGSSNGMNTNTKANANRKHNSRGGNQTSNRFSNNNNNNSNSNNRTSPPNRFRKTSTGSNSGIEKLREAFMQTLSADRERRQTNANANVNTTPNFNNNANNNTNSNTNSNNARINHGGQRGNHPSTFDTRPRPSNDIQSTTESRLDQLLRMSKQKPLQSQSQSNDQNNNHMNRSFRDRNQTGQGQGQQNRNGQGQGQQHRNGNGQYNYNSHRNNTYHNNYHNNNNSYYNPRHQQQEDFHRSNQPSEAKLLQQELMKEDPLAQQQHMIDSSDNENDKQVILPHRNVSVLQLSSILRVQKEKLIRTLRELGEAPPRKGGLEQDGFIVDVDMAELVSLELGLEPMREKRGKCSMEAAESRMRRQAQSELDNDGDGDADADGAVSFSQEVLYETYPPRPPVVCIMGHVDHGKTTLMDRLREKAAEGLGSGGGGGAKNMKKSKKSKKNGSKAKDDGGVSNVAGTEAGGITQVVSAFQVQLQGARMNADASAGVADGNVDAVTFLDTPGHAAFKAMRQSGSNGADVIVLVVAADDGVSPQTIEIIDMYKSIARAQPSSISMVVAMTKIDKPGIDIDESIMRIENQLMEHDIFSERMATSNCEFDAVPIFPLSGMTGDGLDDLIEGLILQSEIMDLRACQESRAEGLIIDAKMEKGLGVVVDCIIRWGKLEPGDYVLSGVHGGKVRILNDVNNKSVKLASPSQPIRIVGLKSLPKAGDPIVCVKSEEFAKELIAKREALLSTTEKSTSYRADDSKAKLDVIVTGGASKKGFMANNVLRKFGLDEDSVEDEEEDDQIRIPVVLKADADGTLAALRDTILAIQGESKLNLCIDPIEVSIGHVTPTDVNLAAESGAAIFCFNLKGSKDKTAMSLVASNKVEIRSHDVIYHLLDEAKDVFSAFCPATPVEKIHGEATVQAVFDINNNKDAERVAGLMVSEGRLYLDKLKTESGSLNCEYRIKRDGTIVADGLKAKTLRRVKEEVKDVRRGEECGLNLLDYTDIEQGDVIECYSVEMKRIFV